MAVQGFTIEHRKYTVTLHLTSCLRYYHDVRSPPADPSLKQLASTMRASAFVVLAARARESKGCSYPFVVAL